MRVRLVRKLADELDGVDVSGYSEGDVIDLPAATAGLLMAEGWVVATRASASEVRRSSISATRAIVADRARRRQLEQLRRIRDAAEDPGDEKHVNERRRAEDRIREELHDRRAKTIKTRR